MGQGSGGLLSMPEEATATGLQHMLKSDEPSIPLNTVLQNPRQVTAMFRCLGLSSPIREENTTDRSFLYFRDLPGMHK